MAKKIEQKTKKKKQKGKKEEKQQKTKQILNGCTLYLFTMRQEDQTFDKALLGENN